MYIQSDLFKIGIVWENVDKILDHSVAEVILLLEMESERRSMNRNRPDNKTTDKATCLKWLCAALTTVWTMCGLCMRKLLTVWNTSRRPSAFTLSRMLLSAIKVPVRPAPALWTEGVELMKSYFSECNHWKFLLSSFSLFFLSSLAKQPSGSGSPAVSGQISSTKVRSYISLLLHSLVYCEEQKFPQRPFKVGLLEFFFI